jgi:hypothetical protein
LSSFPSAGLVWQSWLTLNVALSHFGGTRQYSHFIEILTIPCPILSRFGMMDDDQWRVSIPAGMKQD